MARLHHLQAETHSSSRDRHGSTTSRLLGSARQGLAAGLASGVGLSFPAWPAGWVSPSRRGRGVGLLWAVVVAGLTGGGGGFTDLRKEKKKSPGIQKINPRSASPTTKSSAPPLTTTTLRSGSPSHRQPPPRRQAQATESTGFVLQQKTQKAERAKREERVERRESK
uniref:Uncharacterized protein n=1 Tax=Fagus sylvatica TaxID=28930 RepID=A0A2N9IL66_FAGSY